MPLQIQVALLDEGHARPNQSPRNKTQSDQSRMAKITTPAVTNSRRGVVSRPGCIPLDVLEPVRDVLIIKNTPLHCIDGLKTIDNYITFVHEYVESKPKVQQKGH